MCSTGSSARVPWTRSAAAPCWRPVSPSWQPRSRAVASTAPSFRTGCAVSGPHQFRAYPVLELADRVLLGHEYAALVRQGMQAALVDFADLGVLAHHDVGEVDGIAE